jgi:hypothetical protein
MFNLTYAEKIKDITHKDCGMLIEKTKKFPTFKEAVLASRYIANTNINLVGKPIIDLMEK